MGNCRNIDIHVFDKPWFHELPENLKLFWFFIILKCDEAGLWKVNRPLAEFHVGEVEWDTLIEHFKGQIEEVGRGKLWLPDFVPFQCPSGLSETSNYHKKIRFLLEKNGLLRRVYQPLNNPSTTHIEEKRREGKSKGTKETVSTVWIRDLWNETTTAPIPRCDRWTSRRHDKAKTRLKDYPEREQWEQAFQAAEDSVFCRGENDTGWTVSIDTFLDDTKGAFQRALEGVAPYRGDARPNPLAVKPLSEEAIRALEED